MTKTQQIPATQSATELLDLAIDMAAEIVTDRMFDFRVEAPITPAQACEISPDSVRILMHVLHSDATPAAELLAMVVNDRMA